ncbi:hypothetical protein [Flavobacterium kingsejongi]|uniref:Uncharacterized protein n=1 Tax=Flavobacterium kingsejongi TaxID=1678728 RepID=A0A2S1LMV5_9FLAO|nr:hypothetical protein [Flavobacterium kingsejongi]AWG24805.1 hypothetical protein FK004_05970 [Flavobacterium kingsejongi]AWG25049.1 hypothetical protein FK004_07285 [Flavobacterium kingsejongi]
MENDIEWFLNQKPEQSDKPLELYHKWCLNNSVSEKHFQKVFASPKICHWFMNELKKCNDEFIMLYERYENLSLLEIGDLYGICILRVFSIYPKTLLDAERPKELPMPFKIDGIRRPEVKLCYN